MSDEMSKDPTTSTSKSSDPWMGDKKGMGDKKVSAAQGNKAAGWERDVMEKLVFSAYKEQRRTRRWGIFFKSLMFAYLIAIFVIYMPSDLSETPNKSSKHTALVEIRGAIAADTEANADSIISALRDAFNNKHSAAIIMRINSPGGSPVQAGYINDEIKRLRAIYPNKPLYAVVTDMCASGGYYIAAAADEIYADKASLVGSIGVIMNGFGFVGAMEKLGIERRMMTAGENKGFMDPFSPLKAEDEQHISALLGSIHQQFIDVVKEGRGARLKDDPAIFSGLVWTGEQAIEVGLVDALGSSSYVAREIVGAEKIVDYTYDKPVLERFVERFGASMASGVTSTVDNLWR